MSGNQPCPVIFHPKRQPLLVLHQGRAIAGYGATTFTLKSVEVDSPVSGVPFT